MAMEGYPRVRFRYTVEIEGIQTGGFSEATGFDASIDVIEYREGDMKAPTPKKVQGLAKYGNVTLRQGFVEANTKLLDWIMKGLTAAIERKTVTISLLDESGSPVASWQLAQAWPVKYTAPDFNATSSEVAIESLEIAHEGLTRTK